MRRSWERGGASDGIDWTLHLSFLSPSRRFPSFFPHSCRFKLFQTRAPQFCSPIVQQAEERRRRVRAWDGRGCHSKRGGGKRFFFSIEGKYMRSFYLFSRVRACARRGRRASASLMSLSSRLESRNECASQSSNSERATEVTSKKVMERNVFFFLFHSFFFLPLSLSLSRYKQPSALWPSTSRRNWVTSALVLSLSLSLQKQRWSASTTGRSSWPGRGASSPRRCSRTLQNQHRHRRRRHRLKRRGGSPASRAASSSTITRKASSRSA